ncbi:hypothetical protein [Haloferula rosea]|uniref:Uncharacterized protein n=1 Tax=Haloferula rosea TaxID=490093 RepID=A0A934R8X7_9BACT|nr:hypothetical protein [Haloferula rosea]MBK1826133.1 hypothetical protein [Haloferula rosea]
MMISKTLGLGSFAALAISMGSLQAAESYVLKEPDPEVGLAVETLIVVKGGVTESSVGGATKTMRTDVVRRRAWQRTFHKDALGGKVSYRMVRDEVGSKLDGQENLRPGPLAGKVAIGRKNGAGNWAFMLETGTAVGDQVDELKKMEEIENRRWLPNRMVEIGETWEFVPQFIRGSLRKDIPDSVAVGLMELMSVEKKADGSREALIKVVVRAGGESVKGVGNVVGAEGALAGNLVVNLDKPGTMTLRLNGTVVTAAKVGSADSVAKLPVTMRFEAKPMP